MNGDQATSDKTISDQKNSAQKTPDQKIPHQSSDPSASLKPADQAGPETNPAFRFTSTQKEDRSADLSQSDPAYPEKKTCGGLAQSASRSGTVHSRKQKAQSSKTNQSNPIPSRIPHSVYEDLLYGYSDDVLSDPTRKFMDEHLVSCSICQKKLQQMKEPLLKEQTVMPAASDTPSGFLRRIQKNRRLHLGMIAALILLLAASLFGLWKASDKQQLVSPALLNVSVTEKPGNKAFISVSYAYPGYVNPDDGAGLGAISLHKNKDTLYLSLPEVLGRDHPGTHQNIDVSLDGVSLIMLNDSPIWMNGKALTSSFGFLYRACRMTLSNTDFSKEQAYMSRLNEQINGLEFAWTIGTCSLEENSLDQANAIQISLTDCYSTPPAEQILTSQAKEKLQGYAAMLMMMNPQAQSVSFRLVSDEPFVTFTRSEMDPALAETDPYTITPQKLASLLEQNHIVLKDPGNPDHSAMEQADQMPGSAISYCFPTYFPRSLLVDTTGMPADLGNLCWEILQKDEQPVMSGEHSSFQPDSGLLGMNFLPYYDERYDPDHTESPYWLRLTFKNGSSVQCIYDPKAEYLLEMRDGALSLSVRPGLFEETPPDAAASS